MNKGAFEKKDTVIFTVTIENFNNQAARFSVFVYDASLNLMTREDDISFDTTDARYVGSVLNEGFAVGGIDGNEFIRWIERPSTVGTDEDRVPGTFGRTTFTGAADGIPEDPADSVELDAAIIGNPALGTGLYAFSNAELYDITILSIPGNSPKNPPLRQVPQPVLDDEKGKFKIH